MCSSNSPRVLVSLRVPAASGLLVAALLLATMGCATAEPTLTPTPGSSGYALAAEGVYASAQKALSSGDYLLAASRFQEVRAKFAYTRFGPLAELGLADTRFAEGKYLEAVDAYRAFVRARPTHDEADYAAYRVGVALAKEAPSDFFLFPPAHEKDMIEVAQAAVALERFLQSYDDSTYRADARELLRELRRRLAGHELYVAGFYRRKGKWLAVTMRLEKLLKDYPDVGLESEARVALAEAYLEETPPRPKEARRVLDAAGDMTTEPKLAAKARLLWARLAGQPGGGSGGGSGAPGTGLTTSGE